MDDKESEDFPSESKIEAVNLLSEGLLKEEERADPFDIWFGINKNIYRNSSRS